MMRSGVPFRRRLGAAGLGLMGLAAGCDHILPTRSARTAAPAPQTSSALLGTGGPVEKITASQAADVEIALARTLEDGGEIDKAEATYRNALKKDPRRGDALARLAILSDGKGKHDESARLFGQAIALRPDDPDLHCDFGYSLYLQRRWAEAEAEFRKALALKPEHSRAHNNLGLVMARSGRQEEALAEFRRAGCDASDAHANLALALGMEGRWIQARQQYGQALLAKPNSTTAQEGVQVTTRMLAASDARPARTDAGMTRASAGGPTTR